jgi:hypothetical protein
MGENKEVGMSYISETDKLVSMTLDRLKQNVEFQKRKAQVRKEDTATYEWFLQEIDESFLRIMEITSDVYKLQAERLDERVKKYRESSQASQDGSGETL